MRISSVFWLALMVSAGAFLFSSSAAAYKCTTITSVTTLQIPNMVVPRDAAIGSKVGSSVSTGSVTSFNCTNEAPGMVWQKMGVRGDGPAGAQIAGKNVYLLGSSGIGYTVMVTALSSCSGTSSYVDGSSNGDGNPRNKLVCGTGSGMLSQPMKSSITVDFYKTGEIKPGKVSGQQMAAFTALMGTYWQIPESAVRGTEFTLSTQGCSVTNTSIKVPMGTVKSSAFNGVGSTTGEQSFSIPLNCDAGVKVGLTITGGSSGVWNADNGLINLDSSSSSTTAAGVKLQVLMKGAPIKLNSLINVVPLTTQGAINVPMSARYYQSAAPITAGSANATATFTMKYE